jgi:ribonuclease III family protein
VTDEYVTLDPPLGPDRTLLDTARLSLLGATSLSPAQVQCLSPAALAYLGDVVYELYIRHHHLFPPKRLDAYHQQVVAQVRAERQAAHLQTLEPHLTDSEREVVKRGRNAAYSRPRRLDPVIYQRATSLETLVGYLYLIDPQRLVELFSYLKFDSSPETL